MEFEKFMSEYKKHSPKEFYNWLSKGRTMEVRFLNDFEGNKFNNWNLIETLSQVIGVEKRYNSLFINSYEELKAILLYRITFLDKSWPLTRLYNIFIGVNPRRKVPVKTKSGLVMKSYYGGIAGTSHVQNILCDIEHTGEREGNATEAMLDECIQGAKYLVKTLELESYYINISGNGTHLWFDLEEPIPLPIPSFTEFADKIKYNLKEEPINSYIKNYNHFIEKLDKMLKEFNPKLKVDDGAKDIARIARAPGSWNVKSNKAPRAVGTVAMDNQIIKYNNKKYTAAKPLLNKKLQDYRKLKTKSRLNRYIALNLRECPLYNLLISKMLPSTLSRNHYLEQSFARILRDNEIGLEEVSDIVAEIDSVQQKAVQVDPDYLDDDEPFNSETVNAYCYACKIDFVYKILEDVPDINDGYITEEHYNTLNSYSKQTVEKMAINGTTKRFPTYFDLKQLIRNLCDKYERATVFFTLKNLFYDEWEYLDKNKIVLQIMNKTRRRIEE